MTNPLGTSRNVLVHSNEVINEDKIELHESAYLLDLVMGDLIGDEIEEEIK